MNFIKLQAGCFIVSLYVISLYIRETTYKKRICNKYYDILLFLSSFSIFFDGITAWTVNNLDIVPPKINLILHCIFYLSIDFELFFTFIYMLDQTKGIPKQKIRQLFISIPFIISLLIIFIFLKDTFYVHGRITNYSMGVSAISCFSSSIFYFSTLLITTLIRRKYIERHKLIGIFSILFISFSVLLIQVFFPQILITSLASLMILIGLYVSIEDPSLIKLKNHNNIMVTGFATLVESRDNSTGGHIIRTKSYVTLLLQKMKKDKKYQNIFTKDFEENMKNATPLHDIGKITTPDYILQKPGKLTSEEFQIMKNHAIAGGEIIINTFGDVDSPEFLKIAFEVACYHHEKWNGTGYPEGLAGNSIPLCARIMSIADVFDAVSAKRCYRDALPLETCFQIIKDGCGTDFDPDLVKIFLNSKDEVIKLFQESSK